MLETLIKLISRSPLRLNTETSAQDDLEVVFRSAEIDASREHRLSARDRPDFMVGRIAVELKVKGTPKAIYHQLERYAEHDEVDAIILVTNKAMSLPSNINGKPARLISMGRSWL